MKKKFTFLMAALMLLTMMVQPGRVWGQTRADGDTHDFSQSLSQLLNNNATISSINIPAQSYPVKKVTVDGSYNKSYNPAVTIEVTVGGTSWGTQQVAGNGTFSKDFTGTATVGAIVISFTNETGSGTGHGTFNVTNVTLTEGESSGPVPTTYTVTYHSNVTGNDSTEEVVYTEGDDVTVANNTFSNPGYAFTKWNTNAGGTGTDYLPGAVIEDIDDDWDLYAQWEESNEATATLTQTNLELTGSYSSNTSKTIDGITYVHTDLMKNNSDIQAKASTGTIKNTTPYPGDIISVAITHSGTARATTINGSADGTNWSQVATGDGSLNADFSGKGYKYFQITRGSNAAYWTKIEITYSTSSSSQITSDLEITNASTDLEFDLYPSAIAQVINYTTSSTGAITITPATSDYFSYVHNAQNKTITVTPTAVTPSAQTVTISQEADDDYYAGEVSFTVSVANSTPFTPVTYNKATSIVSGKKYIIVGFYGDDAYAMGEQQPNNRSGVGISVSGTTATVSTADVHEVTITALTGDDDGYYTIVDEGYLYAASISGNQLKTKNSLDDHGKWKIEINNGTFAIAADKSTNRNVMQFNYNGGSSIFACYASASQSAVYLYAKEETFTLDIDHYTSGNNDGWYLIASPIEYTLAGTDMVNGSNYDLYRFNPTAEDEWENYRALNSNNQPLHSDFTTLEVGKGYLYANANDIILSFTGVPEYNSEITIQNGGWNLIGNPLGADATLANNKPYYKMNGDHNGIMAEAGSSIASTEGVFVHATTNETVTFIPANGKEDKSVNNALVINLNRNDKVIDRAIVRFGESEKLSKFQLFEGSTKIYIPQNDADYAIAVMDDNTQAFSLNFHAKTTGKYNLSLGETSNLSYVHLFDRMTGEDIDMLLEDSYSFIGSPADSEERFIVRLNYNASPTGSEIFAYQSGNGIIVNGEGELQIFDVTGRMVMTTTINGVQTVNGLNNGLYIFKLNEKTQKIVVR